MTGGHHTSLWSACEICFLSNLKKPYACGSQSMLSSEVLNLPLARGQGDVSALPISVSGLTFGGHQKTSTKVSPEQHWHWIPIFLQAPSWKTIAQMIQFVHLSTLSSFKDTSPSPTMSYVETKTWTPHLSMRSSHSRASVGPLQTGDSTH